MGKTTALLPSRKEDNKALFIRTLLTLLVAVVFVVLLEFALYKFILPQVKEATSFTYQKTNAPEVFVVDKGDNTNFMYCKSSNGAWSLLKNYNDSTVEGWETTYETDGNEELFHYGVPSAFDITINWVHYVVWGLMLGAIAGYYVYWFIKIKKYYAVHPETEVVVGGETKVEKSVIINEEKLDINEKFKQIDQESMAKAKAVKKPASVAQKKPATKSTAKPKTTTKK